MNTRDEKMPMAVMQDRRIYRIRSRNLVVGAWRAETQGFIGIREKFGDLYLFEEYHSEVRGTAFAWEALDMVPDGVEISEDSETLFKILTPLDAEINRRLREDYDRELLEAESKRWAPKTLEEVEREERLEAAKEWWREQRELDAVPFKELVREFAQRLKEAYE